VGSLHTNLKGSFKIKPNQVSVWCASLKKDYKEAEFHHLLSNDELIRANKFYFEKDKANYIYARALLRILSSKYLNIPPQKIQFGYSKYGKPFYDIEYIKDNFDVLEIANNFFSKKEIEQLKKIPVSENKRAFFRCWTRKEAFIKAEGSGLSFPLDKFTVTLKNDNEANLLNTYWDEKEKSKWSLKAFSPYANYLAAVAVKGNVKDYNLYDWDELIDKH